MLESFYCLDNDIILKLTAYNLFNDTLNSLEIDHTQVKILDTFKYKFGKQIKRKRTEKVNNKLTHNDIKKALEITKKYVTVSEHNLENIDLDIYAKLENYSKISQDKDNKIDKGEAILISHVCYLNQQGQSNYLLTGDKRCLRALTNSGFTYILVHLEGKIWCLEQLILKNIEQFGFDYVQSKIYQAQDCDTNIKLIFGYSEKLAEEIVQESFKSEIMTLKKETGKLLYPYPN